MKKLLWIVITVALAANCSAVTSKIIKQKSMEDFTAGKTQDTVINSRGNITLAAATETLAEDFNDTWLVNSIVKSPDGSIYLGTSPNGRIFRYKDGKTACIWPAQQKQTVDTNDPNEQKNSSAKKHLQNLHIFRLALDNQGKLLAAVSGEKASLIRFDGKKFQTVFEPNNTAYIFAIELDKDGNIFLGTGPDGNIWQLDKKGHEPQIIYTSKDKNILCLAAGADGFLYAGTDTRGLVYKIDIAKKNAVVLYDAAEDEITDILFDESGNLYAAATSYKSIKAQMKESPAPKPFAQGKPETAEEPQSDESQPADEPGSTVKIANTGPNNPPAESAQPPANLARGRQPSASHIYKIDPRGFVTDVFSESAVFFALNMHKDKLFIGTGNKAELFSVNPQTEIETLIYQDKTASQITDIISAGNDIYFCTANPAKLIMLKPNFSSEGSFESSLIDAGQPAQWGKLQLDADMPEKTKVFVSARTGNIDDVNDKTFSQWTTPQQLTAPVDLAVPLGRFCQYKLILHGTNDSTPVIREVAAAFIIPNLAPKVTEIVINRPDAKTNPGIFQINFKAEDLNDDQLTFKLDFRKTERKSWIELKKDLDKPTFDWDGRTVEDGIYEIRVTASDELSNNQDSKLTGSRISDPVIVDNTPPEIEESKLDTAAEKATLKLKVKDQYSVIESLSYTIDSNEKWLSALPDDSIFDTKNEDFTITADNLTAGSHVLAVRISDVDGNKMYKTFDVEIK
jgi:hypothetical protein